MTEKYITCSIREGYFNLLLPNAKGWRIRIECDMGTAWLTIDDEPFIGEWPSVEDFVLAMIEAYKSFWTTSKEGDLALCKKIMDDIDAYELIFARKEIVRAQNEAARAYSQVALLQDIIQSLETAQ